MESGNFWRRVFGNESVIGLLWLPLLPSCKVYEEEQGRNYGGESYETRHDPGEENQGKVYYVNRLAIDDLPLWVVLYC